MKTRTAQYRNVTNVAVVVCPAAELHDAVLFVEREVLDVDLAVGLVDGRRAPLDRAARRQLGLRVVDGDLIVTIGAGGKENEL